MEKEILKVMLIFELESKARKSTLPIEKTCAYILLKKILNKEVEDEESIN